MKKFLLDSRLKNDCFEIHDSPFRKLLLMNNSDYLWFIIVPKVECSEFFELEIQDKNKINLEMDLLSKFIRHKYKYDKINIGIIGNIVRQLHIHIVGRRKGDAMWPGVAWGSQVKKRYTYKEFEAIKDSLIFEL